MTGSDVLIIGGVDKSGGGAGGAAVREVRRCGGAAVRRCGGAAVRRCGGAAVLWVLCAISPGDVKKQKRDCQCWRFLLFSGSRI